MRQAILGLLAWLLATAAPAPLEGQVPPRFRGRVDVVALDVCVKDRDGRFIPELAPDDFLILENRTPQTLEFFLPDGRLPLSVVLLLDRSTSMAGAALTRAKAAATAFLDRLEPTDRVEVMAFNELADRRYALGANLQAAAAAIASVESGGRTGLYEALLAGLRDIQRVQAHDAVDRRQVLLVLSDGEDTSSRPSFDQVLEEVRRSGALVYAVSLRTGPGNRDLPPSTELMQLAADSGGRAVTVRDLGELDAVYTEIAAELRQLYRLGYIPTDTRADGAWRTISIRLADKGLRARTRRGYYAPR